VWTLLVNSVVAEFVLIVKIIPLETTASFVNTNSIIQLECQWRARMLVSVSKFRDVDSSYATLWQTYLQGGESGIGRTDGGWKFPELTERTPEVRPIPDSPNLQVCLVFITCHFGKILKSTEEFYTHFTF
jgi:hypothetical protein